MVEGIPSPCAKLSGRRTPILQGFCNALASALDQSCCARYGIDAPNLSLGQRTSPNLLEAILKRVKVSFLPWSTLYGDPEGEGNWVKSCKDNKVKPYKSSPCKISESDAEYMHVPASTRIRDVFVRRYMRAPNRDCPTPAPFHRAVQSRYGKLLRLV
jgi:hypothetical protein